MTVFTLPNPHSLEESIAKKLEANFACNTEWHHYSNGEWMLRVLRTPKKAIVLGRTEAPGDNLVQTLTVIDTLKRNGAKDITLVLPYFGYSRQDHVTRKGDHLPADLLTTLFKHCGATRIVTVDLHNSLTQKNSPIPLISIDIFPEYATAFKKTGERSDVLTIVSPDHGSKHRADAFRDLFDRSVPICWLEKQRNQKTGTVHSKKLFGEKQGTTALIVDDICDTGGTVKECVRHLKKNGFTTFYLCITHPVFSGTAIQTLCALKFKKIFVSNTIPLSSDVQKKLPLSIIDVTPILLTICKKVMIWM